MAEHDSKGPRFHPQQGRMPPNNLPLGQWYDLNVKEEYPEGNVRIYCSVCGTKNRMDQGWRYCRDKQHAVEVMNMTALLGPSMRSYLGASYEDGCPNVAMLKYECDECREDEPYFDEDEDEEENEDKGEDENGEEKKPVGATGSAQ